MAGYHGDVALGQTVNVQFTTVQATGAPTTLAGSPVISAYVGSGLTQITAGVSLSVDHDSVTGLNNCTVVASGGNGFATATDVSLIITTGTVNGVSAVGYAVGAFSIENRSAVRPTTAGRTLDVAATGEAGLDFTNVLTAVGSIPVLGWVDNGTLQSATSTTAVIRSAAAFADSQLVGHTIVINGGTGVGQARLITASVGSTDTITVDTWTTTPDNTSTYAIYATAPSSAAFPSPVNVVQINSQTVTASGGITFPAATLASTTNIASGVITTVTGNVNGNVSGSVASVTGAVGSVTGNVGGNVGGSVASVTGNVNGNVIGSVASVTAITATGGVVSADVKKVNSTTVNGVGTSLNPWGP